MGFFSWIIMGALAGWIASIMVGKNEKMGCLANIFVGIIGAIIGGFIASKLGMGTVEKFNLYGVAISVFGAVIWLFFLDLVRKK